MGSSCRIVPRPRSPIILSLIHICTFDPITFGHMDVVRRALRICPRVTVAVAESLGKNGVGTTFTLDERVELARRALDGMGGVDVMPFTGLLVDRCV